MVGLGLGSPLGVAMGVNWVNHFVWVVGGVVVTYKPQGVEGEVFHGLGLFD